MTNIEQHTSVEHPFLKAATALAAGLGVASWSDFAAFCASIYSLMLIGEWLWKRFGRAFFERHGWIKHRMRRKEDKGGC